MNSPGGCGEPNGIFDFICSRFGCALLRDQTCYQTLLSAGCSMNRGLALAGAFATVAYFSLAYYFKISHVEVVPRRDDVAAIPRLLKSGTPGVYYAHLWLPNYATRAIVYENGVSIGEANAVYDDPTRTWSFEGRRWKFVEFNSSGEHVQRWIVFSGRATSEVK